MNKKELIKKAEKAIEYLNSVSRNYDYRTIYCVNVKRYSDYEDIEELIKTYTPKLKETIRQEFTEEFVGQLYQSWLEYEGNYFIDEFLKGECTLSSDEWYEEEIKKMKDKKKIKEYENNQKYDRKIRGYLGLLDKESFGFYGRSGGWFGLTSDIEDKLTALIGDIENGMKFNDLFKYHYIDEMFDTVEAIEWVLKEADKFNKGLSWKDELIFRIEQFIETEKDNIQAQKEINQARTLAKKHGYILASEIK